MTDAEARDEVEGILIAHTQCTGCPTCTMLRFVLVALADREALVEMLDDPTTDAERAALRQAFYAARRHMEGK